jgi:hypothetical protein
MDGRFVNGGCCLLDFYLLWVEDAIHRKDVDVAYHYSRQLAHCILVLMQRQHPLFEEDVQMRTYTDPSGVFRRARWRA